MLQRGVAIVHLCEPRSMVSNGWSPEWWHNTLLLREDQGNWWNTWRKWWNWRCGEVLEEIKSVWNKTKLSTWSVTVTWLPIPAASTFLDWLHHVCPYFSMSYASVNTVPCIFSISGMPFIDKIDVWAVHWQWPRETLLYIEVYALKHLSKQKYDKGLLE